MSSSIEDVIDLAQHRSAMARVANMQVFWVFLAAVIACVALSLATDSFATSRNLFNVSRNFAFVAIIAIGMTAVIASGGIDLILHAGDLSYADGNGYRWDSYARLGEPRSTSQ